MTEEEIRLGIEKALDEIRPFLISDGGNISLIEVL
jgi:Fe-S cluster biogenesis protein NfuA